MPFQLRLLLVTVFIFFIALSAQPVCAQDTASWQAPQPGVLDMSEREGLEMIPLDMPLRYHPGDDPRWASPEWADSLWRGRTLHEGDPENASLFWYRLRVHWPEGLEDSTAYLHFRNTGALELYLNGQQIYSLGKPGRNPVEAVEWHYSRLEPVRLPFHVGENLLAVRLSNFQHEVAERLGAPRNQVPLLVVGEEMRYHVLLGQKLSIVLYALLMGIALAFTLLHTIGYFIDRRFPANLYYALFSGSVAFLVFNMVYSLLPLREGALTFFGYGPHLATVLAALTGVHFVHSIYKRLTLRDNLVMAGLILAGCVAAVNLTWSQVFLIMIPTTAFWVYAIVRAARQKVRGLWTIVLGFSALVLGGVQQALLQLHVLDWSVFHELGPLLSMTVLLLSFSIYLAQRMTMTSQQLEERMSQVRELTEMSMLQEMERVRLEEENRRQELALTEANRRRKVLDELERTYRELNDAQTQLIQSEKMASLGKLVAGVAHELNTPIGAVSSMQETLTKALGKLRKECEELPEEDPLRPRIDKLLDVADEALRVIGDGARRTSTIVRRLRSFARLDEADRQRADINAGIRDTLALIAHELKDREIEVVTDLKEFGKVPCYPARLNQVVLNLVMNAMQAIEKGGMITVRSWADEVAAHIEVEDNGSGIDPENLDRIFDPGFTTKGRGVGTGLGLAISYQIMQEHGGSIAVESWPGRGSNFTLSIPLGSRPSEDGAPEEAEVEPPAGEPDAGAERDGDGEE